MPSATQPILTIKAALLLSVGLMMDINPALAEQAVSASVHNAAIGGSESRASNISHQSNQADSIDAGRGFSRNFKLITAQGSQESVNAQSQLQLNKSLRVSNYISGTTKSAWRGSSFDPDITFQVSSFGTSVRLNNSAINVLQVDNNWSDFSQYLDSSYGPIGDQANGALVRRPFADASPLGLDLHLDNDNRSTSTTNPTTHLGWKNNNGLSIAFENNNGYSGASNNTITDSESDFSDLILSWSVGNGGSEGRYKVAALGRTFDAHDINSAPLGWGVNLDSGWNWGNIRASLNMTFGSGIGASIANGFGKNLTVQDNNLEPIRSFNIRPALGFDIGKSSSFHVAVSHYQDEELEPSESNNTLDTLYLGYLWKPWPGTSLGLDVLSKKVEGSNADSLDDTTVRIGAKKVF
jgi:hypothetical protein